MLNIKCVKQGNNPARFKRSLSAIKQRRQQTLQTEEPAAGHLHATLGAPNEPADVQDCPLEVSQQAATTPVDHDSRTQHPYCKAENAFMGELSESNMNSRYAQRKTLCCHPVCHPATVASNNSCSRQRDTEAPVPRKILLTVIFHI